MSVLSPVLTRRVLRVAAVVGVLLVAFTIRVVTSAASELAEGDALREAGDKEGALVHYRRAARWYAPGSPYHVTALNHLGEMAEAAERDGDTELALAAYRAIRAAIMSARSFYVPERDRLEAANARIADLMSSQPPPPMDADKPRDQLRQEHLALLREIPGPHVGWTLLLLLGFAAGVGGAFAFTMRAIDEEDRWVKVEALRWGATIVVGFGLFVLGMVMA